MITISNRDDIITIMNYRQVIKDARKKGGAVLLLTDIKNSKIFGNIRIKIKNFKKVGLIIDMDYPSIIIPKKNIDTIERYLRFVLQDIKTKGFEEELIVSKSFLKVAVYKGDEESVIPKLLNLLLSKIK